MALGPLLIFALGVLSGVVALLTSYYAYRFSKVASSPLLGSLAAGFMLLGIGLLLEAGTSAVLSKTLIDVLRSSLLAGISSFAYLSIQMVAYLVFAMGYAFQAFGRTARQVAPAGALIGVVAGLYRYAVLSYFVVLILLAFIVFQGLLIHSKSSSRFSMLVLLAFVLILVAHVVLLASVLALSGGWLLLGDGIQFLGFLSLMVFLLRSGRVGPG
jgi:hypothetical protein